MRVRGEEPLTRMSSHLLAALPSPASGRGHSYTRTPELHSGCVDAVAQHHRADAQGRRRLRLRRRCQETNSKLIGIHVKLSSAQRIAGFSRLRGRFSRILLLRIAVCLHAAQYRSQIPDCYQDGEPAPKYSATLPPRRRLIWMRWLWQFTIEHQSSAEKLLAAPLRVYDNIISKYASPEVLTPKSQSC